ncbi:hypothetical protein [Lentzea flava]|uniref:hypothetical protein n=1 Tax=Lentzea flava TaxID=103732 RepID=UPI0016707C7B|nr:hypothetical protein [Lentzea flava]
MNVNDLSLDLFLIDRCNTLWMYHSAERDKVREVVLTPEGVQYSGERWWHRWDAGFMRPATREDLEKDLQYQADNA